MSRFNPFRLLCNVSFGFVLIALTAIYIATHFARRLLGSWFDQTDAQFFNSWPLTILLVLLVVNLIIVTWRKVPLTPPRYGRWFINVGIITLACGMLIHFHFKVDGRVRLYVDPGAGPTTVDHFYDRDERSLYVRIGTEEPVEIPLPALPRFGEYDESALTSRGLMGIAPTLEITDQATGNGHKENLAELIGCKGQQLQFDVVGFYPNALTFTDFAIDPASKVSGVNVSAEKTVDEKAGVSWWLVGSDPRFRTDNQHALIDMRHVDADAAMVAELTDAAGKLFHLDVSLPDQPATPLDVQIGKSYAVGKTGYTLKIERFIPDFPMSGTGERVSDLTMLITTPTQTFRRMVLQDKTVQTDFKLDDPADGTMGQRQKTPLDAGLVIDFHVHDPFRLLPEQHAVKHTLLTPPGGNELIDIVAGIGDVASEVKRFPTGAGEIEIEPPGDPMAAPGQPAQMPGMKIHVQRQDHLKPIDMVKIIDPNLRDKTASDAGLFQVVKLKVTMGDWAGVVYAPFAEEAGDRLGKDQWHGGFVLPPGAIAPLQVQLGSTRRPLPARLTLDQFKLSSAEDPVSTITLSRADSDLDSFTDVAKLNHPISFRSGNWIFSQASYDSVGRQWTELHIGNRPAVNVMLAGCVMIFVGFGYAVFAKPIVLGKMKQRATAEQLVNH